LVRIQEDKEPRPTAVERGGSVLRKEVTKRHT